MAIYVTARNGMGEITYDGANYTTTGLEENDFMHFSTDLIITGGTVNKGAGDFEVTQNGTPNKSVNVAKGVCYVPNASYVRADGTNTRYWRVENTATVNVAITDNASGNPRIDIVCVKIDTGASPDGTASNVASVVVVAGTPAASPSVPATPSNYLKIAEVAVANGFTTITNANITDRRADFEFEVNGTSVLDIVSIATDLYLPNKVASGNGNFSYDRTNKILYIHDGSTAYAFDLTEKSYTPTLTNLTLGNGTLTASYHRVGKRCHYRVYLLFGSTTSISGSVSISLPFTAATYDGQTKVGEAWLRDNSPATNIFGFHNVTGVVSVHGVGVVYLDSANLSSTVPFTWATGDYISIEGSYEMA